MASLLKLDYGAAVGNSDVNGNVTFQQLKELSSSLKDALLWLKKGSGDNEEGFGWIKLPSSEAASIREQGDWLRGFENIIQIGIGGSALGNRMLNRALLGSFYNEIPISQRRGPRFYLAENVDPVTNHQIWERVDPEKTALLVISKSGSTGETMANFLFFFERMTSSLGRDEALGRLLVITDPEKGSLRSLVNDTGCRSLEVPPGVGGRYSVLSAVGLAAAHGVGIDIEELLEGARDAGEKISSYSDPLDNPACVLAALSYLHGKKGRNMNVLMPYSDRLADFVEWYAQLWAESIGKEGRGYTPVRALGAVDQHSQVQLYTEGPDDKLFTIINLADHGKDITIPVPEEGSLSSLSYMGGKSMEEMIGFEAKSTASAISDSGKPVVWIELPRLDGKTLGGLIVFYQYATAITGYLLDIDPFNQPGVEQGKNYTYGLMGREGFEENAGTVEEIFSSFGTKSCKL